MHVPVLGQPYLVNKNKFMVTWFQVLRYQRAHNILYGEGLDLKDRFDDEKGASLLEKIFETYQVWNWTLTTLLLDPVMIRVGFHLGIPIHYHLLI